MAALDVSGLVSCEEPVVQASQNMTVEDIDAKVIEAAVKASPTPLAFVCMDGGIFDCNIAFSQMLGYPHNALLGNTIYMHAAPVDIAPLMSAVCELITGQQTQLRREVRFQHKDGHLIGRILDMSGHRISADKMYLVVHAGEDVGGQFEQPHQIHISLDMPLMPAVMPSQGCAPHALAQSQPINVSAPAPALTVNRMRPTSLSVHTTANLQGENLDLGQAGMRGVVAGGSGVSYLQGGLAMQGASPQMLGAASHHQHQPQPLQQLQQLQQLHYAAPPSPALQQPQQHARQHLQLHHGGMHPHMPAAAAVPDDLGFFGGEHGMPTLTGHGMGMMLMGSRESSGLGGLDLMDDSAGAQFPQS
jgi:PAS domain S-box-containing protein